ncbi:FadR/GntR family transcriptional regulator [Nocardia stercoris]|uniref:FadR family transcriptional regulator n=1 Tax=Nocardia stercoris TaxID=2483361 RepID=A0A3M2LF02_9NOCA|nr:FCD domain-containing protein [Nocardia stercoris]RMI35153.1 FadR family transcriptional regulator [Nocardia stercoris]
MQPVRRTSLIAQVTEQLRTEIRSGRWAVGSRIPTEPELTELTGTGRNTVREAVQALVHAGMLERRQGSGTYVIGQSDLGGALSKYFAAARQRDVFELRRVLDNAAARLAAERRDETDIATLWQCVNDRNVACDTVSPERFELDTALHRAVVSASHNAVYLEFYESLIPVLDQALRSRVSDGHSTERYNAEHIELVAAIEAGDPDRAATAADGLHRVVLAEYD